MAEFVSTSDCLTCFANRDQRREQQDLRIEPDWPTRSGTMTR